MTEWRNAMREAAEQDEQDHLSADEAQAIRRVVLAAVADAVPARASLPWMRRPVLVAATLVAMISAGIATRVHFDPRDRQADTHLGRDAAPLAAANTADHATPNRQLQFVTPGGTRIIWVFNSDLNLTADLR